MVDPRIAAVSDYHARSKHALDRYASGPGTLDWEAQPKAFRDWHGTQRIDLPREVAAPETKWGELALARPPLPLNAAHLASFLRLCVGLTAWKEHAGARWALRAHPSSGNLHPTETWLIASGVPELHDGLYHYHPLHHALERRAWNDEAHPAGVWLGFSSIHWREAWKYGERAFRYCQLDMGHVLAAVSYAAALHGWRPRLLGMDSAAIARSLGLDRAADFAGVESEEAEMMLELQPAAAVPGTWRHWAGKPELLDTRPLYQWPIIEKVAVATHGAPPVIEPSVTVPVHRPLSPADGNDIRASQVILKRRSAQAFDGQSQLPQAVFKQMLAAMLPGGSPVWQLWPHGARVHPVLLVHRVEGVAPGVYIMPRADSSALRAALRSTFAWQAVDAEFPLFQLITARAGKTARTLSCHQDIATQCAVTVMMVAEFAAPITADPAAYRHLHWEAGMLGHVLTLEAEAAGWRGTGIGCFFDDAAHEVLGIKDQQFQVIYHYAIGMAVDDPRIATRAPYEE